MIIFIPAILPNQLSILHRKALISIFNMLQIIRSGMADNGSFSFLGNRIVSISSSSPNEEKYISFKRTSFPSVTNGSCITIFSDLSII